MRFGAGLAVVLAVLALAPTIPGLAGGSAAISVGADVLLDDSTPLAGQRIGLVTHQAGTTQSGELTLEALARQGTVELGALFAPEHGLDGSYGAGQRVPTASRGGTPVYSLYGGTFRPTRQMLSRVDTLVVDLQDVGVRPYTYASTMALVLRAAAGAGKRVVILDRPNPLSGLTVDGPVLEPQFRSFIGLYPIPYVHGMTMGELAAMFNRAFGINAKMTVIPMAGWQRQMVWADTGLPWANPSPGLVDADIAPYYAATGSLDGTNLWNGTSTPSRFRVVLAPWINGPRLAERLNRHGLPGVRFTPSAIPWPNTTKVWSGVRLHVTDPRVFKPTTTAAYILAEIRQLHGNRLEFRKPRRGYYLFDLVWGTKQVRLALQRGASGKEIVAAWQPGLRRFARLREEYLLYD